MEWLNSLWASIKSGFFSRGADNLSPRVVAIIMTIIVVVGGVWWGFRGTFIGENLERLEYPLLDLRHRWYASEIEVSDDVVMLVITDQSLETFRNNLGRWPWPRQIFAALIQHMSRAERVMFDIGFWEPSQKEVSPELAQNLFNHVQKLRQVQQTNPARSDDVFQNLKKRFRGLLVPDDQLLGQATGRAGQVVHSLTFDADETPGKRNNRATEVLKQYGWKLKGDDVAAPLRGSMVAPIEELIGQSQQLAHVEFTPDVDGVARRFRPFIGIKTEKVESKYFPLLGLTSHLGADSRVARVEGRQLKIGEHTLPLDEEGAVPIRYRGGINDYTIVSIDQVIKPLITGESSKFDKQWFEDKSVLIGATAAGLFDLRSTPISPVHPGVGIHAAAHDMLESGDILYPARVEHTLGLIFLMGLLVGLGSVFLSPFLGLGLLLLLLAGFVYLGFMLFFWGQIINMSMPILTAILAYGAVTTNNVLQEQQQREFVREAFQHYLPETVMETVLASPEDLELRARRRRVTMLFMDIAGFTSLSEGMEATEVAGKLSELLTRMTRCVFEHDGILDKFIGDEMMCEFGMLDVEPDKPEVRAVRAADDILKALEEYNRETEGEELDIRIGLNTGMVAAGNMGSADLFDYTVIGDDVNLGSRLEGVNKFYNTRCMMSQATAEKLGDDAVIRELDRVRVKGREEPVTIFEWIGWREDLDGSADDKVEFYEQALGHYRNREFEQAVEVLENLADDDPAAEWLRARCLELINDPPGDDWEPITTLTSK